jgi:hypothetical protein
MLYLLILAIGIYVGFMGPVHLSNLLSWYEKRQILRDIMPHEVDEKRLCRGPHGWMSARTYTDAGPGKTQVCQVCGFIPSINKMATEEALDRIEENNKIYAMEDRIYRDFQKQEDGDIKKYFDEEITHGVSFEKLTHLHGAGMTFGARFKIYKSARATEIEEALKRNNS